MGFLIWLGCVLVGLVMFGLILFVFAWVPHYLEYGDEYKGNLFTGWFRGFK